MHVKRRNTNFTSMSGLEQELGVVINSHTETPVFKRVNQISGAVKRRMKNRRESGALPQCKSVGLACLYNM